MSEIRISNFRGIKNFNTKFTKEYNEIKGMNGLGKTTILDAIRYILTGKDFDGKSIKNINYINDKMVKSKTGPTIISVLMLDKKIINLKLEDNKWFINERKISSQNDFYMLLSSELGFNNQEQLFLTLNPESLYKELVSTKNLEAKDLRKRILTIANSIAPQDSVIGLDEMENLFIKKEKLLISNKQLNSENKLSGNDITRIKENSFVNQTIDWTKEKEISDLQSGIKNLADLEKIRDLYTENIFQANSLKTELDDLNYKNNRLGRERDALGTKKQQSNFWKILLIIFTLGIYYFINKNNNRQSIAPQIRDKNNQIIENKKNIKNQENLLDKLDLVIIKWNQANGSIQNINDKIRYIKDNSTKSNREIEIVNSRIRQVLQFEKLIAKNAQKISQNSDGIIDINHQLKVIVSKAEKVINANFNNIKVSVFDSKGGEKMSITKNGISFKDMNYSARKNAALEIINFINKSIDISTLSLIDNLESINKIFSLKNNQLIGTKVSTDGELKIINNDWT